MYKNMVMHVKEERRKAREKAESCALRKQKLEEILQTYLLDDFSNTTLQ